MKRCAWDDCARRRFLPSNLCQPHCIVVGIRALRQIDEIQRLAWLQSIDPESAKSKTLEEAR